MTNPILPGVRQPYTDAGGHATNPFHAWCSAVDRALQGGTLSIDALAAQLADMAAQIDAIEPGLPLSTVVVGANGIDVAGSLAAGAAIVSLADLDDNGTGTLLAIDRDAQGRIEGTRTPTTTDLAEGTNLYHTAARVLATVLAGLSTASAAVVTAADSVLVAIGKLQAQITAAGTTVAGLVIDSIADADTTHAPSRNAVFDALENKLPGVTPERYGAAGDGITDDTAAVQAALTASPMVSLVNTYLCGPLTLRTGQVLTGSGTLQSTGAGTLLSCPVGQTSITLEDFECIGVLLTNDTNALDVGIYLPENGFTLRNLRVRQFAATGILPGTNLTPSLSVFDRPNSITGCKITRNGCGIDTGSFEYINISDNLIAENGFNAAKANFSPVRGASPTCAGLTGNLANIAAKGNTITGNAYGLSMIGGTSAPNPDHNMIAGNTINHNAACGLYIEKPGNYELISSNTIVANVGSAGAPSVVPVGGTPKDMILIDAHALTFMGNAIGHTDVYGQARCRYIGNELLHSFVEKSHPAAGSPVTVTWGFTLNSYNLWSGNWFYNFTRPTLWAGGVGNIIADNIEHTDGLVDGVQKAPTINADWISPATGFTAVKYWREAGNRVRVVGSVQRTAGATISPFTLPAGFRPSATVDTPAVINGSGALGMVRVTSAGVVNIFNPTTGAPVIFDVTFVV